MVPIFVEPTVFEKNILPVVYDNKLLVSFLIFTMKMRCRHLSAVFICVFCKYLLSAQVSVNIHKDMCSGCGLSLFVIGRHIEIH